MTAAEETKQDERVNRNVRQVAEEAKAVGLYSVPTAAVELLYKHADLMRTELFQGAVPEIVISFDKSSKKRLGHYVPVRNGLGLKWNINLNPVWLGRPPAQVIGTLCHEMAHAWQGEHGKPGKGNYHNAEFIEHCKTLGLPTNGKGHDLGIEKDGAFWRYCAKHGIALTGAMVAKKELPKPKGSPLKKWTCGCTNVRVAVEEFSATCNNCGNDFEREG